MMIEDSNKLELLTQRVELELRRISSCVESSNHRLDEKIEQMRAETDKKLEYLNGVREALRDQANRMIPKDEAEAKLQATAQRLESQVASLNARTEAEFKPINEKLGALGKPNWTVLGTVATFGIATITACWLIIGLKIDASISPVNLSIEQLKVSAAARERQMTDLSTVASRLTQETLAQSQTVSGIQAMSNQHGERLRIVETNSASSAQADVASRTDRQQLNERLRLLEGNVDNQLADRKSTEATLRAALVEIETQFCASDTVRNLMHANDLRVMSMLWDHANLGTYPINNAYYPTICNRDIQRSTK